MTRVLIIKPSSLGDIIHGLQAVECFKSANADWHITWVVREIFAPLVHACETVDQTLVFQRKKGLRGLFAMVKTLSKMQFDLVIDLQGLLRSGLMTWSTHAPRKLGRADAREGATLFYNEKTPASDPNPKHALDVLLAFAPLLNAPAHPLPPIRFKPSPLPQNVAHFLESAPFPSKTGPVLIFPDSRRAEKKWPFFEDLTRLWLQQNPSIKIIWSGSEPASPTLPPELSGRFLNLCAKTPLESLPQLIEKAGLVIANDSGPMHLAAAMGKPTLAIFGPTDPALYGPFPPSRPTNHVVRAPNGILANLPPKEVLLRATRLLAPE
jgi:ADP-heptose:LPS heptosyltransferase